MHESNRVYVAGHRGLVGSAICRRLARNGFHQLLTKSRAQLDLLDRSQVNAFFASERPEYVFLAAAKVGGIVANHSFPAEFIFENLTVQNNVIDAAWRYGVRKLLFLGSSCIYPKLAPQPLKEEYLLTGPLEETNEAYAVAKIAGIKLTQAYRQQYGFQSICLMPANLYGPGDNFDLDTSHVLPALLRKFQEATTSLQTEVMVWGSGCPRREFLHVDDLAAAAVYLMQNYHGEEILNVGTGEDLSIRELAEMIARLTGFRGRLVFDASKPDGTPRKVLDTSRLNNLGWRPAIPLEQGLASTYQWYLESQVPHHVNC